MSHARRQHPNAPLTPEGRRRMVDCVIERGWTVETTGERFQVDAKTVRKWRDRFLTEGEAGLNDRSSRPHRSPNRTPRQLRRRVIRLRRERRWGADHIGFEIGLAASTVQNILNQAGIGRLDRGDRATASKPVLRYQWDEPGDLIHVDIKKLGRIPDGGGRRTLGQDQGRKNSNRHRRYDETGNKRRTLGYAYIHSAVDDRSRLVYSEILTDEKAATAAGFWTRAAAWFRARDITPKRVLTDNGSCYRSGLWHRACTATGTTVKKTRPRRPQTNGKVERFHGILLEEWAYIRHWNSEAERHHAYPRFIHLNDHHRPHGSLGWATPTSILKDNLPAEHT